MVPASHDSGWFTRSLGEEWGSHCYNYFNSPASPLDIGHCTCLGVQLLSSAIEWKYAFLPGYGRGSVIVCKALGSCENQQSAECNRGEFKYYFSRLGESVLIAKGTKVERRLRFQGGAFEVLVNDDLHGPVPLVLPFWDWGGRRAAAPGGSDILWLPNSQVGVRWTCRAMGEMLLLTPLA